MNDKVLRQNIFDELEFEPSVNAAQIGVAVDEGVVTLTGHVASYAEKIAAERAVQRVKGVAAIAEEISVRYIGSNVPSDDELAKRVLNILAWDALLPADAVKVKVEKGWVTLSGALNWQFERKDAEKCVRKLHGVVGVTNLIDLKAGVQADGVKKRIESAFKRNAELDAAKIRVEVNNDKVTLEGNVHAWNERFAAESAAWAVPGVSSVIDHLRVV
jgi:osmotically-inducible protein OsmY